MRGEIDSTRELFYLSGLRLGRVRLKRRGHFKRREFKMRLKSLLKYGIPEMIIEAWTHRQGDYLLPLQERAVAAGLLSDEGNLLISAPTSSGKSFCGEMAAMAALLRRRKVVMLFPLKSIVEEKYRHFNDCYAPLGIRTVIVTGDHPENDCAFEAGEFDLALAIYEKFNRLLTVNLDILQQVGLIIIDELQMISEEGRGPELEMSLVKTLGSEYSPRLVALSAVLHDETELLEWLGARLIRETVRPVDLLQGIVMEGRFRYRSFNSGLEGNEDFPLAVEEDNLPAALIEYLKNDEAQNLIFLKSRRDTIDASFRLAAAVNWKEASGTIAELDNEEPSYLVRSLRQVLSRGVSFHNADLTSKQRQAIEAGYRRGEIRVIFSTPTLAMGVNLPAETVFLETMKYRSGEYGGKPVLAPVTAAEYQNIAGRAGRYRRGRENCPGRAVILAGSPFEHEVLWSGYIERGNGNKLRSALADADPRGLVLDLLVSGLAEDKASLERILEKSFYHVQGGGFASDCIDHAIGGLITAGLVDGRNVPTPAGAAAAESGLGVTACCRYREALAERIPESPIGWIALALSGEDIEFARMGLSGTEFRGRFYEKLVYREYSEKLGELNTFLGAEIGQRPLDYRQAAILKGALLLTDWAEMCPAEQLEQRYQLHLGQIADLGETAAWLLIAIGRLIAAGDCTSEIPGLLERHAFAVQYGIDPALEGLFRVAEGCLNRGDFRILKEHDIITPDTLIKTGGDALKQIIKPEGKIETLFSIINGYLKEDLMNGANVQSVIPGGGNSLRSVRGLHAKPSLVELDGRYEGERYLVKLDGVPVRLTGKSFKYLVKLAGSRMLNRDGWIYKDDIETGFNQARYLYRLKQEVNRDGGFPWGIFENNRLGYYRLDVDSSRVRINLGNLQNHPDYELRELAERLSPRLAG